MKKLIFLTLFCFQSFALKGVVRVLEAPLYHKKDVNSPILMNVRKGDIVHIHDNSLDGSTFYTTLTRDGADAFIPKEFVKLIHHDSNELNKNIAYRNDPTNYILDEPIPDNYPFKGREIYKAMMNLNYGQGINGSYNYSNNIEREQVNNTIAFDLRYLKNPSFDVKNRFYIGFHFGGRTSQNEYELEDSIFTQEQSLNLTLGPVATYTFFRRESFEIDTGIQFGFNVTRRYVKQEDIPNSESEERSFNGLYIDGAIFTSFIHRNKFNTSNVDIIHGPSMRFHLPHTLRSATGGELERLWNSDDIEVKADASFSYNLGILYRF